MENIFEKGCLVQLSTSVWQANRKIRANQIDGVTAPTEWVSATKKLVHPTTLKPIKKVVNKARGYLNRVSLPFPINGMVFVPREMIGKVDEKLDIYKSEFADNVDRFVSVYEKLRDMARDYLGDLFDELDYPVDLRAKFSFAWRFVILDVPNGNTKLLAPEVYEREKEKFVQTMEEARLMAIQSLRVEFAGMVSRITERFTTGPYEKPKIFKNGTVGNFYDFFETFKERNIFRDDQLAELVERAQDILGGLSAESIRTSDNIKESIRVDMEDVEKAMVEILSMPRRKIIMS